MSEADDRLVLKITQQTLLKRRVAPVETLEPAEKVEKAPCRIYLHSYAYAVPGEDLDDHFKVCFEAPFMGSSVWYVEKQDCCIEGGDAQDEKESKPGKINQAGLDLIKSFEGLRLDAYRCPAGIATIGYGTTSGVKMGDRISAAQAEARLRKDVEEFEAGVKEAVKVPLTDNQFSALVCFTYNVGLGNFQKSTLLKLLNQSNYSGAAQEFQKWNKGGGKVLAGLVKRRKAEQNLFLKKG